ncbi:unnamed protein product, partial [Ectocarpus sp. 12 AP-2014]
CRRNLGVVHAAGPGGRAPAPVGGRGARAPSRPGVSCDVVAVAKCCRYHHRRFRCGRQRVEDLLALWGTLGVNVDTPAWQAGAEVKGGDVEACQQMGPAAVSLFRLVSGLDPAAAGLVLGKARTGVSCPSGGPQERQRCLP